ncbi:hypothetical protein PG990_011842 [Apiospora arundinis]
MGQVELDELDVVEATGGSVVVLRPPNHFGQGPADTIDDDAGLLGVGPIEVVARGDGLLGPGQAHIDGFVAPGDVVERVGARVIEWWCWYFRHGCGGRPRTRRKLGAC